MTSRVISSIFNAKEPEFSHKIADLERLSGGQSHDIRVVIEALHHFKKISAHMDLDSNDTTLQELYHSLLVKARQDSEKLAGRLGIKDDDAPPVVAEKCAKYLEKRVSWRKFWCVKHSVIKKQLKSNTPKNVIKILGFRSMDSLLKREPAVQTLVLARIIEGAGWQKKYIGQAGAMTNSDFDEQAISVRVIDPMRMSSLKKAGISLNRVVYTSEESSDVIIAPVSKRFDGDVLFYFDSIVNHINGIISRSAFYRYKGLQPDLFKTLKDIRDIGFKKSSSMSWPIRWSAIVHSIQYHGNRKLADRLELNIPAHDLFGLATEREMQQFGIWEKGLVHGDMAGGIVSMHLSDAVINAINQNKFENAYSEFGKNRLYDELFSRYLSHDSVLDHVFDEDEIYE